MGKEKLSDLEKCILILTETDISKLQEIGDEDIMKEYLNDATDASKNEEILELYNNEIDVEAEYTIAGFEQGLEQGIKQGIEQGIKQGKIEKAKEIALTLLKKNTDINTIFECTGLSIKELEALKKNI